MRNQNRTAALEKAAAAIEGGSSMLISGTAIDRSAHRLAALLESAGMRVIRITPFASPGDVEDEVEMLRSIRVTRIAAVIEEGDRTAYGVFAELRRLRVPFGSVVSEILVSASD